MLNRMGKGCFKKWLGIQETEMIYLQNLGLSIVQEGVFSYCSLSLFSPVSLVG